MKIHWRITDKCNFSCPYCFHKDREKHNLQVGIKDVARACAYLYKRNIIIDKVTLVGGEPTLHDNLQRIIDVIYNTLSSNIVVSTNGFSSYCFKYKKVRYNYSIHPCQTSIDIVKTNLKLLHSGDNIIVMKESNYGQLVPNIQGAIYRDIITQESIGSACGFSQNLNRCCTTNSGILTINIFGKCKLALCDNHPYLKGNIYNNDLEISNNTVKCSSKYCVDYNKSGIMLC